MTKENVIIHLVLKYRYFDMMIEGVKDIEYREITPHWTRLIWDPRDRIKRVRFLRGYTDHILWRTVKGIDIGPCPYDGWDDNYYRIHMPPLF